MITALFCILLLIAGLYGVALLARFRGKDGGVRPLGEVTFVGAIVSFFDTLGIGSFAPTTAYVKFRKLVPDKLIPATLIVGLTAPTIIQALIFIQIIEVDATLLASCIGAAVAGAWIGARFAERLPTRHVQIFMGTGLFLAATIYSLSNLGWLPAGGSALALPTMLLVLAVAGHFVLGILMNLGIGLYAPALIMLSLMGLDPRAAFPIMMGACAFLMPTGSLKLLRNPALDLRVILGLGLGGIPAVLVAAYIIESLPLDTLRWGVVVVVFYASFVMLRSAWRKEEDEPAPDASPAAASVAI